MRSAQEDTSAEETRRDVAEALTTLLHKTADATQAEQAELARKFPAMTSQPPPVDVNPEAIRDFTQSEAYRQAVEAYVQGRTEQHIIVTALRLLRSLIPGLLGGV